MENQLTQWNIRLWNENKNVIFGWHFFILEIILNVMEILAETLYTIIDGCREFRTRQQK